VIESKINVLVLYAKYADNVSYYDDWIDAFVNEDEFHTTPVNLLKIHGAHHIKRKISESECIVLHHSTNADTTKYIEPFVGNLRDRKGVLLSFVGNEYNRPVGGIREKRALFNHIEPDFVATQCLLEAGEFLFGDCVRERVIAIPHALNPGVFTPERSLEDRPIDIGVRSEKYFMLGDNERNSLFNFFLESELTNRLVTDIKVGPEHKLHRRGWAGFLNKCKGTIANESGSWYLDLDDSIVTEVREWALSKISSKRYAVMMKIRSHIPLWILALLWPIAKSNKSLYYGVKKSLSLYNGLHEEELIQRFYRNRDNAPVYAKCISSRHFDAIGTKTCQILIRGKYNDILMPDEHYIAMEPDFSNAVTVIRKFTDVEYRKNIVDRAYEYVRSHHTYSARTKEISLLVRSVT